MEWREHYPIERLGDRIGLLIELKLWGAKFGVFSSKADVRRAVESVLGVKTSKEEAFKKYYSGATSVPFSVVRALHEVFPLIDWEIIATPSFADFEEQTRGLAEAIKPWLAATEMVGKDRGTLARNAKRYYREVDEAPADFPLVARREWIELDRPVRLEEGDFEQEDEEARVKYAYAHDIKDATPSKLMDGRILFQDIKLKFVLDHEGSAPFNGKTFRLLDFGMEDGRPSFAFSPGRYFNYVDTLEVLASEFAMAGDNPSPSQVQLRGAPETIFDWTNRSAFPGVNTLLMIKNYRAKTSDRTVHKFALHQRSTATLEAQNTIHIVPAGGHQPLADNHEKAELSIWQTVVREFVEELFDKETARRLRRTSDHFLDHPEVKPIVNGLFRKPGAAACYYLGMGFDPLTTKPEILTAVVINWKEVQQFNDTFEDVMKENNEGIVSFVDLTRNRLWEEASTARSKIPLLPAAEAALRLAAQEKYFDFMMDMK